jgi:endopolyphosphatase
LPRTPGEIYDLNRAIASKMEHIFHKKGIPVVPSIGKFFVFKIIHGLLLTLESLAGNNDVWRKFSYLMGVFII